MAEQYEEIEDDINNDDNDDDKEDDDLGIDTIIDREARRVLFDTLHVTYHFMRIYKREKFGGVFDKIGDIFEVKTYLYIFHTAPYIEYNKL